MGIKSCSFVSFRGGVVICGESFYLEGGIGGKERFFFVSIGWLLYEDFFRVSKNYLNFGVYGGIVY